MTDVNEAIARWMGWTWNESRQIWARPNEAREGYPMFHHEVPRYTESLDALVPVMEEMPITCTELEADSNGKVVTVHVPEGPWDDWYMGAGETWAEALRNAIYAALVAMGEVDA